MATITIRQLVSIAHEINMHVYELEQVLKNNNINVDVNQACTFRYSERRHILSLYR